MKIDWLHKNKSNENIILFFGGWGVDYYPFQYLTSENSDLVMFYDYKDLEGSEILTEIFNKYKNVNIIAWSLGVWVAATLLSSYKNEINYAIALNGSLKPIDDSYGIPVKTFQATIDNFSIAGRNSFNKRMCRDAQTMAKFIMSKPAREIAEQKEELIHLQDLIFNTKVPQNIFTDVIIGDNDRIIPTVNQIAYWQSVQLNYKLIKAPHFIFYHWTDWEEIYRYATANR